MGSRVKGILAAASRTDEGYVTGRELGGRREYGRDVERRTEKKTTRLTNESRMSPHLPSFPNSTCDPNAIRISLTPRPHLC